MEFRQTVDLGYRLRYHPFQGLLPKQQLDCMMNPLQSMLVNCGSYCLKSHCCQTAWTIQKDTELVTCYRNSLIDLNLQSGGPQLESPVWGPATGISSLGARNWNLQSGGPQLESPVWGPATGISSLGARNWNLQSGGPQLARRPC